MDNVKLPKKIIMEQEHQAMRKSLKKILDSFYVRNDLDNTHLYDAMDEAEELLNNLEFESN